MIPEIPISSRQISNVKTSGKGEITINPSTKEVYDKMESDMNSMNSVIKEKIRNTQINKSSSSLV
jgi:hypothetical protein